MRKRVEQRALKLVPPDSDSACLLAAIVDSSDDAIISKSLDGIITSWNRAAERMFGYSAEEAIGRHITLVIPPERHPEEDLILARLRRGEKIDHLETVRRTRDGCDLNVSLVISPVCNAKGEIVGASQVLRDITERARDQREREELLAREQAAWLEAQKANRLLKEQLDRLQIEVAAHARTEEQLTEALSARDDFIAVAAHELRNPLNVFLLTLEMLYRLSGDPARFPQMRGLIEKSRVHLNRISLLLDRLLDVARMRAGKLELYRERFNLGALVKDVADRFAREYSGVVIALDIAGGVEGYWDRIRLDQALTNLVSNAVRYGERKPITIAASENGHEAMVEIRDQGRGISREDLNRIFERFEHAAPRPRADGLGLGLWITKQIAEAHGGAVHVESELGKGATFFIRLPLQLLPETAEQYDHQRQ